MTTLRLFIAPALFACSFLIVGSSALAQDDELDFLEETETTEAAETEGSEAAEEIFDFEADDEEVTEVADEETISEPAASEEASAEEPVAEQQTTEQSGEEMPAEETAAAEPEAQEPLEPAPAAEPGPAPSGTAEAEEVPVYKGPTLDEVIVTAQKRAEDVQDVPISVTAIGEEELDLKGIEGLGSFQLLAPNTKVDAGAFFNFIYVRGIGSDNNQGFDSSVGLFFDGMYMGRRAFIDQDFVDVDRVELLRGPQGALFGKNTLAGAFAVYTNPAPLDQANGNFSYKRGFENFLESLERIEAALGAPIIEDVLGFRASIVSEEQDGFMYNTKLERWEPVTDNKFYRFKTRWQPTPNWDIHLSYDESRIELRGSGAQLTHSPDYWLEFFRLFDPDVEDNGVDIYTSTDAGDWAERDMRYIILNAHYQWADHTISVVGGTAGIDETGFLDVDFSPAPVLTLLSTETYDQYSGEIRLTSPEADFQYIVGAFGFYSEFDAHQSVPIVPLVDAVGIAADTSVPPEQINEVLQQVNEFLPELTFAEGTDERTNIIKQTTTTYSVFGEANLTTWEDVIWTMGIRYTYEKKTAFQQLEHANGGLLFFAINQEEQAYMIDDEREEHHINPRLSVAWHLDDDQMVYGSVTNGSKAGGFNASALSENQTRFEDESSYAYEIGYKSMWFDGRVLANATAFHSIFRDLQVSAFNGEMYVVTNAADAISQGIELQGAWLISEYLVAGAAYGYLNAYYEEFRNGPCIAGQGSSCDLTGRPLPNAPQDSGFINLTWDRPIFNWPVNFHLAVDAYYQGFIYFQTDLDPLDTRDPAWLYNARIGFHHPDAYWSLIATVVNVEGARDTVGSADVPIFEGAHFGGGGGGRTIAVEARFKF